MRIRSLLASSLLAAAPFAAWGDGIRLAVLAPDDPDGGALLEAELGKRPGVVLIERTEIDRVFREQALGAVSASSGIAAGQLLHADALLIVSRNHASDLPLETARLVAVQPGVVIDSAVLAPDRSLLSAEASRIAAQFEPLLGKAGALDPSSAVKVSLLGLHFELNSPSASGTERALNTLLANRLTHRPRIVVLERWNLNAAAWEKDLPSGDPAPFWTGSCLIDGRLVAQGNQIAVEMRLRPPSGPPRSISVAGPSNRLAELADTLADRVAAALNAPEAAFSWDRKEEALNETLLAHWALGNRIYQDAFEATATADALCPHVPDIDLLRLEAEAQLAFPHPPIVDRRTWSPYNPARDGVPELPAQLGAAEAALDHLRTLWTLGASDPGYQPAAGRIRTQSVYTVQLVSRLLEAAHEHGYRPDDEPGLAALRQRLRDIADLFLQQDASFQTRVCADLLPYASYWFETPAETLAFYQRLARLPGNPAFPDPTIYLPHRWIGASRGVIGWHGEDPAKLDVAWQGFLDALKASPSVQDQVAGWAWAIESAPLAKRGDLLPGLAGFAWENRAEATRPDGADLSPIGEALAQNVSRRRGPDDSALQQLAAHFLPYLFQGKTWIRPRLLHGFGLMAVQADPQERNAFAAQFAAYRTAMAGSPSLTASATRELDLIQGAVFGSGADASQGERHFPARFIGLPGPDGLAAGLRNPVSSGGRVWFIDARQKRVVGWDPADDDAQSISYEEAFAGHQSATGLAVGSRYIFVETSDQQVWEYDRDAKLWTHLAGLPPGRYQSVTTGEHAALLYSQPNGEREDGGIFSLDPATHAVTTVLSGRSNPPRNDLDGKPDSRGLSLHLTDDGRMDYIVKLSVSNQTTGFRAWSDCHDDLYTQRQPGGPWERVLSVTSTFVRLCHLFLYPTPQGALLLAESRLGSTRFPTFCQLISWDRSSGKMTLLLANPAAAQPPLPGVAQWEMPPDLAATETLVHCPMVPALQGDTLWVLRWEGLQEQGMERPAVYRFRPGFPTGERLSLDFDPTQGVPEAGNKREGRFLRPENVAVHPSGFVLDRSPEFGVWYLPFAEMAAALDSPAGRAASPLPPAP